MPTRGCFQRWVTIAVCATVIAGCGSDLGNMPDFTTVEISPFQSSVVVGGSVRLFASALDAGGHVIGAGRDFQWESLSPAIASVDADGRVTGVSPGQARLRASLGNLRGSASVSVLIPPPASVAVELPSATVSRGDAVTVRARALSASGSEHTGRTFTFVSSDPTVVSITPNADGVTAVVLALAPGSARISATNLGVEGSVTLVVAADPVIQVASPIVTFRGVTGAGNPPPQQVALTNAGGGTLRGLSVSSVTFQAGQPNQWLRAELAGGVTTAPTQLVLTPTVGVLPPGTYSARVTLASSTPAVASQSLDIALVVEPRPNLSLAATTASFGASVGGAAPAAQSIAVTNTGGGTLSGLAVSASAPNGSPVPWLAASLAASTAPTSLTISVNPAGLAAGTYLANVTVSAPGADGSPKVVAITFVVSANAVIVLTPSSLSFTAAPGTVPATKNVAISNGGGGSLTGLSVDPVQYGAGQPVGWLSRTLGSATAPAQITVSPTAAALAAGTYSASFVVRTSLPGVAPATVTVTFTVSNPPVIAANPSQVSMTASIPTAIVSASFGVVNGGTGALTGLTASVTYAAGETTGWLGFSFSSGVTTAPTALLLQATVGALSPGTYHATILLSSPVAPASLQVPVTLQVIGTLAWSTPVALTGVAEIGTSAPVASQILNNGAGTVSGLTVTVQGSAASWLSATLAQTTTPATLTLRLLADATSPRGVSVASVTVSGNGVSPLTLQVQRTLVFTFDQHVVNPVQNRNLFRDLGCRGCHGTVWENYTYLTTTVASEDGAGRRFINNTSTSVNNSFLYVYITVPNSSAHGHTHSGGLFSGPLVDSLRFWIQDAARKN